MDTKYHGETCTFGGTFYKTKWQWISNRFGPMGWFSDADKVKNSPQFTDGHWRMVPASEVAEMDRAIAQLAYEQS